MGAAVTAEVPFVRMGLSSASAALPALSQGYALAVLNTKTPSHCTGKKVMAWILPVHVGMSDWV